MIELSLGDIARIVGGRVQGDPTVTIRGNVEFDSRRIGPGDLFVALAGARVDGHDFVEQARAQGAVATLAFRPVPGDCVLVPPVERLAAGSYATAHDSDGAASAVISALSTLAHHVVSTLQRDQLQVIGVTGSAGKTSTKDMMGSIFQADAPTIAPPGSLNNEIGHPYTALRAKHGTRYLVAELSARGIGHVAHLARIAPPDIAVVLNVGSAHLGEFGSVEAIAQAKGELVDALTHGTAILNADDPRVAAMASRTTCPVWMFSTQGKEVELRAENIELDGLSRPSFDLFIAGSVLQGPDFRTRMSLQVSGYHQVSNALAALGAGLAAGIAPERIVAALQTHQAASEHRMALHTVELKNPDCAGSVLVIDDAYNANPDSMRAGLQATAAIARARGSHAWAVLGPMGELGEDAVEEHQSIGAHAVELGIDHVLGVGDALLSGAYVSGAGERGEYCLDQSAVAQLLRERLAPEDVVLLKASNAAKLWQLLWLLE